MVSCIPKHGLPQWLSCKKKKKKERKKENIYIYACNAEAKEDVDKEDPLEEGMAMHSSILVWRIPWTKEPSRLQSNGPKESDMTEVT